MPIDMQSVRIAWRALESGGSDGWQTIPVAEDSSGNIGVRAGRFFPGALESVLIGFRQQPFPGEKLPEAQGFSVLRTNPQVTDGHHWLALTRQAGASVELFDAMVSDVMSVLGAAANPALGHGLLLARLRAWLDFMRQTGERTLGPEAETGLIGELLLLERLINHPSLGGPGAIQTWHGPARGLHDFVIGAGAIEVKTTFSSPGFPARIGSLEQLDEQPHSPLYICATRLQADPCGACLSDIVARVRLLADTQTTARQELDHLLLQAGYADVHASHYTRRCKNRETWFLHVGESFPRLTRATVPTAIRQASYELALDLVDAPFCSLDQALAHMGATRK